MEFGLIDQVAKEQLLTWIGDQKLTLKRIYKASEHGFSGADFHKRCDNKEQTLVVIEGTNKMIFGGYSSISWDKSGVYKADPKGFLFQIRDCSGSKYEWQKHAKNNANTGIYSTADTGPCFCYSSVGNYELLLFPSAGVNTSASLHARGGYLDTGTDTSYLCGSSNATVQIKEVEVYLIKEKKGNINREEGPWRKTLNNWSEQFNNLAPITSGSHGFVDQPSLGDRMHVVALVLDVNELHSIPDKVTDKIKAVRTQAYSREDILGQPGKVDDIFNNDDVYTAIEDASSTLGIPKGHIHPVVNYESEVELDMNKDLLVLLCVRQMLRFADGYFDDQLDVSMDKPAATNKNQSMKKAEDKGN